LRGDWSRSGESSSLVVTGSVTAGAAALCAHPQQHPVRRAHHRALRPEGSSRAPLSRRRGTRRRRRGPRP
jgi:hypothetical protein